MSIFSRLFGQNKVTKNAVRGEIDIAEAINAHMRWKARLQRYLDGTADEKLDPMLICRDDQCALGKWIHGAALNHFMGDEEFNTLRSDHAHFHYLAAKVVSQIEKDDYAGALALFDGEYIQTSRKVINSLTELNKQLNNN